MAKKSLNLNYDPETDILHLSFGSAKKAVSIEREPEVFVRVEPKSGEIVGLTVLGFKNHFLKEKQSLTLVP